MLTLFLMAVCVITASARHSDKALPGLKRDGQTTSMLKTLIVP